MIHALTRQEPTLPWSCLLFSVKESVYKAWYPLTGAWLDFNGVSVQFERGSHSFRAALSPHVRAGQARTFEELKGHWMVTADFILTTVYLPSNSR